ncbi:transcription factor MYB82-like [Hibiscus syriacus]|uniref:Auxin-responsive protein n=1 Tax=Hibiscus syriacus TaxID=106335 RepID=A0A6A3CQK0_HIBSY|nr:transcription factor MYB82-like [Hibiscus syriacus]
MLAAAVTVDWTSTWNDAEGLVRWPPVKTWRHKLRRQIPNGGTDNNHVAAENGCGCSRASNSTYVKVKTEGVGIARKIDIGVHRSFETLTTTLMTMFDILDENLKCFKLAYQDKEGDRLLAEDVPWRYLFFPPFYMLHLSQIFWTVWLDRK